MSPLLYKIIFFGLLTVAVILEVSADVIFKKWSLEHRSILFALGLFIYLIGTIFWALSLKYDYLSKAGVIFTVFDLIAIVLAGVIVFKEDLSWINKAGIGFGILSIILIEL